MTEGRVSIAPGSMGLRVAGTISTIRRQKRMSYAELSRLTGQAGRPIATLGLARLEQGSRRIDVDDLFAIATALAVSPLSLLMVEDKPDCGDCFDLPPRGFTCNSCGLTRPKP